MRLTRKQRAPRTPRPATEGPLVSFGRALCGRDDEADGAVVDGVRLVRGPGGQLIGYRERTEPT